MVSWNFSTPPRISSIIFPLFLLRITLRWSWCVSRPFSFSPSWPKRCFSNCVTSGAMAVVLSKIAHIIVFALATSRTVPPKAPAHIHNKTLSLARLEPHTPILLFACIERRSTVQLSLSHFPRPRRGVWSHLCATINTAVHRPTHNISWEAFSKCTPNCEEENHLHSSAIFNRHPGIQSKAVVDSANKCVIELETSTNKFRTVKRTLRTKS